MSVTHEDVEVPAAEAGTSALVAGARRGWVPLAGAVLLVTALALLLRAPALTDALPTTQPDENTVVSRAQLILDGTYTPPAFDWPLGTSWAMAVAIKAGEALGLVERTGSVEEVFGFGRWVFLAVAVMVVAVTALLAAALARRRGAAVAAAVGGALVAVDFVMVRIARMIQPDHLQVLFVLLALLAVAAAERTAAAGRRTAWLLAAGLSAGVAGGMKYLGITAVVVPVVAALTTGGQAWGRRLAVSAGAGALALVGFVVSTGGSVLTRGFVPGFLEQWSHQSEGHLGYDHGGPTWVHHLVVTLPGSIGWVATVAIVAATAWALWRGDRVLRLVAGYAVLLYLLVGLSRIEFPHYVIVVLPILAAVVGAAAAEVSRRVPVAVLSVAVVLALVAPALDDVRLLRSGAAPDTREGFPEALAEALAAEGLQDAELWTESYTGVGGQQAAATGGGLVFGFGDAPDLVDCRCVVLLSSYQEQRYAADPEKRAVYEELRRRGRVILERRPGVPLTYRWDLLPSWGIGNIPLTGELPALGPAITVLDLTSR